jgi:hypothetical protein
MTFGTDQFRFRALSGNAGSRSTGGRRGDMTQQCLVTSEEL